MTYSKILEMEFLAYERMHKTMPGRSGVRASYIALGCCFVLSRSVYLLNYLIFLLVSVLKNNC